MQILVIGRHRHVTEIVAEDRYPPASKLGRDTWDTEQGDRVYVAIYGQPLSGRSFDRIYCVAQGKATEAELAYLIPRLKVGGRFERHET